MARGDTSARLRQAIVQNDLPLVQRLLQNNRELLQNPNFSDKSNTSLHLAAQYGFEEIAEYLISLGHDCTTEIIGYFYSPTIDNLGISVNTDGHCPLHLAAMHSHPAVVQLLCTHFPYTVNRLDKKGRTPLHLASAAHPMPGSTATNVPPVKSAVRPTEDTAALDTLLANGGDYDAQDKKGNTCLHNASAWGNLKAVRALIGAGADPLCSNYAGWTPEYYSVTVQAEVYYRNLVAEWERKKAEDNSRMLERRTILKGGGAVRLVSENDETDSTELDESNRSRAGSNLSRSTTDSDSVLGLKVGRVDTWK